MYNDTGMHLYTPAPNPCYQQNLTRSLEVMLQFSNQITVYNSHDSVMSLKPIIINLINIIHARAKQEQNKSRGKTLKSL